MVIPFNPSKRERTVCNMCGNKFDGGCGLIYMDGRMPYGSKRDYDPFQLTLCANCADSLFASCKIDPILPSE